MFTTLLIVLLSKPGDIPTFSVIAQFKTPSECVQHIANNPLYTEEERNNLRCLEVRKPREM